MTPRQLVALLRSKGQRVTTAESCTGGMVAAALTAVPGASDVFDCGFIVYANTTKRSLLGVPATRLDQHGAVSRAVAIAMAEGALKRAKATLSIAVTGIAGPGGGTLRKPVGLVHFACARAGQPTLHLKKQFGPLGRAKIRTQSVRVALSLVERAARSVN